MKRGLLHDLVTASFIEGTLDDETVQQVADRLTRSELKAYVKALVTEEKARTVFVQTATMPSTALREKLQQVFKGKKIEYREDPSLLLGVRVTDRDVLYEANLKNSLEGAVSKVLETYD